MDHAAEHAPPHRLRSVPPTYEPVLDGLLHASEGHRGIAWIYGWMDRMVARHGLEDIVIVLEGEGSGRQVFRRGQRSLGEGWAARVARQAEAGVYAQPPLASGGIDEIALLELCSLMFELDVASNQASRDPLTGLPNRRAFERALERTSERGRRYGWDFTLVMIDVDGFKLLNDRQGHLAGDTVLRAIARILQDGLRAGDVAGRLGGDEFALVLEDVEPSTALDVLARLRSGLRDVPHGPVSVSAGYASWPSDVTDPTELWTLADRRLYGEKGRST